MGGHGFVKPRTAAADPAPQPRAAVAASKKRVLFVCIGNSCRSQMAEAFARAYGSDILVAQSAGVAPAVDIAPLTKQVLAERNLSIEGHFPKGMEAFGREPFDVIVNMSGHPLKLPNARVLTWPVRDPIGLPESVYRSVVQQIEGLVMGLILSFRSGRGPV
ncbi:MAG: arsenate reductase ArsC [Ignavibacteriota bacterium]